MSGFVSVDREFSSEEAGPLLARSFRTYDDGCFFQTGGWVSR
jgi:hypothetical protein